MANSESATKGSLCIYEYTLMTSFCCDISLGWEDVIRNSKEDTDTFDKLKRYDEDLWVL